MTRRKISTITSQCKFKGQWRRILAMETVSFASYTDGMGDGGWGVT